MRRLEATGTWWLPDHPDDHIIGNLKFDPLRGCRLSLVGTFLGDRGIGSNIRPRVVLGRIDSQEVTLIDCAEVERSLSGTPRTSVLIAQIGVIGHHFATQSDVVLSGMGVNFGHMHWWLDRHPLIPNMDSGMDFSYVPPPVIRARFPEGTISFRCSLLTSFKSPNQVSAREEIFVWITPDRPCSFDKLAGELFGCLERLLTFATGRTPVTNEVKATVADQFLTSPSGGSIPKSVDIFYATGEVQEYDTLDLHRSARFTFKDIQSHWEGCAANWFEKASALDPVYELYCGSLPHGLENPRAEFLALAQALEAYHRRRFGGTYVDKSEFRGIVKSLRKALPSISDQTLRKNIASHIAFSNEYSFRKRLTQMLINKWFIGAFIGDVQRFVDGIVTTRNFLTHQIESLKAKALSGTGLLCGIEQLRLLLELLLFVEMGLPDEEVRRIMATRSRFTSARNRIVSWGPT